MTYCLCKTPCLFERAKCENLDTKFHDPPWPFSVRTVRTIRTDRRIFRSFTQSQAASFTDWKAAFTIRKSFSRIVRFVRSVKPFSDRTVRTIRTDRRIFPNSLSHKLTLSPTEKLYSRSVNSFHEPYGSYDLWSHFQFVRSVRFAPIDEFF